MPLTCPKQAFPKHLLSPSPSSWLSALSCLLGSGGSIPEPLRRIRSMRQATASPKHQAPPRKQQLYGEQGWQLGYTYCTFKTRTPCQVAAKLPPSQKRVEVRLPQTPSNYTHAHTHTSLWLLYSRVMALANRHCPQDGGSQSNLLMRLGRIQRKVFLCTNTS